MNRKIAYFSPLPPARTGISDYSRELLPHLAQIAEITLFSDQYAQLEDADLCGLPAFPPDAYAGKRWDFDVAVYQLGNSAHHHSIAKAALRYPGIVVLHDYGLHQLWASQTVLLGDDARYIREMAYARGAEGACLAADALTGHRALPHFEEPLNARFADTALGIIAHSEYVADQLRARHPRQRIGVVPAAIALEEAPSLRDRLDLPPGACLFGSFGVVSHHKQLEAALRAFAAVRESTPDSYFLVVGEWDPRDVDLPALVERLGLNGAARCLGRVPSLREFLGWLSGVDVVVNLRHPTVGETSAVALRALAAGRALIVYDNGWYAELPSETCMKLPPLDQAALQAAMRDLAADPAMRSELGRRGQRYARERHAPAKAAAAYLAFVERVLAFGQAQR
jgi:glycosyltransferase involved in cell wall biosynthesis